MILNTFALQTSLLFKWSLKNHQIYQENLISFQNPYLNQIQVSYFHSTMNAQETLAVKIPASREKLYPNCPP